MRGVGIGTVVGPGLATESKSAVGTGKGGGTEVSTGQG